MAGNGLTTGPAMDCDLVEKSAILDGFWPTSAIGGGKIYRAALGGDVPRIPFSRREKEEEKTRSLTSE